MCYSKGPSLNSVSFYFRFQAGKSSVEPSLYLFIFAIELLIIKRLQIQRPASTIATLTGK